MAMIQANDLRVGNVLQSYDGSEFEYVVIQSGDIKMCQEANENFNNWRKPIPITEEWLLMLGFENISNVGSCKHYYTDDFNYGIEVFKDGDVWYSEICKINFIHQLQNIHHALTGQELTIKP